jgi:hypothetical protein
MYSYWLFSLLSGELQTSSPIGLHFLQLCGAKSLPRIVLQGEIHVLVVSSDYTKKLWTHLDLTWAHLNLICV